MKTVRKKRESTVIGAKRRHMAGVITRGVEEGLQVGHRLCPVDKGDLISTFTKKDDGQGHAELGTGGPSNISDRYVSHHIYIEYGTSKMPAQPNYRPGVDAAKQYIRQNMRKG